MRKVSSRLSVWTVVVGVLVASAALVVDVTAQGPGGGAPERPTINVPTDPALQGFTWRSIGPVGQGARIDDYAVDEKKPSRFFIGYAVSGVWRTMNNATTFDPIFDTYGTGTIGDLALAPSDPNVLYVGTGEANNRQSASFGKGVFKSTNAMAPADQVKFEYVGLKETQSIGRIDRAPDQPEHRVGRGGRASVRTESRARRLHDDRRRQDVDEDALRQRQHGSAGHHHRPEQPAESVGDDVPSISARRGATTAAGRAAASIRAPTAARRGRR